MPLTLIPVHLLGEPLIAKFTMREKYYLFWYDATSQLTDQYNPKGQHFMATRVDAAKAPPRLHRHDTSAKYNHETFLALPLLSDRLLSRNLCVIVLSAESRDQFGNRLACCTRDDTVRLGEASVMR